MSLALARKYRPRNFAGVAVQSHVSDTLRGAIARGRVAHGYLLCGPRGTGKTTLARVLAMALNCENKGSDGEPCGECTSCQRIWSGSSSLDVVEIDAASNRGVDDARDLRERAMYAPSGDDRYKVYIVDEAHMLTREAWNALLKILEEPPPRVVFVFATTEPQKIAQAAAPVLSRLQRFDLKRISVAEIIKRLETVLESERISASGESLAMIARAADGSMRDALSLTDQVISLGEGEITAGRVREALGLVPEDEYLGLIDIIAAHRAGEVFEAVRRLADGGVDFAVFLSGLGDMLRAQLAVVLDGRADNISPHALAALEAHRDDFSAGDLLRMLSMLSGIEPQFRRSSQQQLLVEMLLVRFALLDRSVTLEEVLQTLGGGRGSGGGTERPAARPGAAQAESRASARPAGRTSAEGTTAAVSDLPAEPVLSPPTPPLRVTPAAPQRAIGHPAPSDAADWKAGFDQTANSPERSRLTTEAVREERLATLRAHDPVLDAAVRELDLDLLD
ncbi:MAG: DNA polymerase III subunit gamma/tau [Gemmatimonadaceae bacterium]|nr:DNA polymerase III subunit gamma/tau [Gemmatimonadaceae bacterium]